MRYLYLALTVLGGYRAQRVMGAATLAGMTATVTIRQPADRDRQTWFDGIRADLVEPISDLFSGVPPPRLDCLQGKSRPRPETETIPYSREPAIPSPESVEPGLAPGIDAAPRKR